MRSLFILFFITLSIVLNSQEEKRLALVTGTANYDKGVLKNPVNDALLIAKTSDFLNFVSILDTNLETKKAFFSKIK